MCNLSKGVEERGRVRGRIEGRTEGALETTLSNIKSLMETLGLTMEQAMTALKVPESERDNYAVRLNGQ